MRPRPPGETPRIRPVDLEKAEEGVRLFLEGLGIDLDDSNVRETPPASERPTATAARVAA